MQGLDSRRANSTSRKLTPSSNSLTHQCDICLEEFPEIEMLCARGSQKKLTVQEAREGCRHFSCKGCMEQYVQSGIEARRYPLTCPCGQGCDRWIMYGDVLKLLSEHPEDLRVRT